MWLGWVFVGGSGGCVCGAIGGWGASGVYTLLGGFMARGGGVLFWALSVDGVLDLRLEPGSGFFWPFAGWGVRLMGCVSSRELGPCARLVSRGLSCWEASVTTYLRFRFQAQSVIAICSRLCRPEGVSGFLPKILCSRFSFGKCLFTSFKDIFCTFAFTFNENGGLNHITFLERFFFSEISMSIVIGA